MSNQSPVTEAELEKYYVLGFPLLKLLGIIIVASAIATLAYEFLL